MGGEVTAGTEARRIEFDALLGVSVVDEEEELEDAEAEEQTETEGDSAEGLGEGERGVEGKAGAVAAGD